MAMTQNEQQSAAAVLKLAESLDLSAVGALAEALKTMRGQELQIDASDVRRIGALCLQVLLSAKATWTADGQVLNVTHPSGEFIEAITLLGAPALGPGTAH